MKYNFYLLTVVLFVVVLSACSAPAQREQPIGAVSSAVEGGTVAEKEKKKEAPTVDLPTATPPAEAYPVVDITPFPTAVPYELYEDETIIAQIMEQEHISHDDAKYHLKVNNALLDTGLVQALLTRYPDSYAFYTMEKPGKNQEFVHFFSETVDEENVLKEARKYIKEEWMKHIKVRKVKYSVKKLEADLVEVNKIIETQIRVHPEFSGFLSHWGVDYGNNAVSIGITDPAQFQSLLKEKGITFPEMVRIDKSTKFVNH